MAFSVGIFLFVFMLLLLNFWTFFEFFFYPASSDDIYFRSMLVHARVFSQHSFLEVIWTLIPVLYWF